MKKFYKYEKFNNSPFFSLIISIYFYFNIWLEFEFKIFSTFLFNLKIYKICLPYLIGYLFSCTFVVITKIYNT